MADDNMSITEESIAFCDAPAHIADLKFNQPIETDTGALVGPGFSAISEAGPVEVKNGYVTFRGDAVERVFGAFDEACLDAMIRTHGELFPKSDKLSSEEIEDMFKPLVKRAGIVRVPLVEDAIVEDHEGNAIDVSEVDGAHATLLVEFGGFDVQADGFTPVVGVAEIMKMPPPPPAKRTSRLKKQLASAVVTTEPEKAKPVAPKRAVRIVDEPAA